MRAPISLLFASVHAGDMPRSKKMFAHCTRAAAAAAVGYLFICTHTRLYDLENIIHLYMYIVPVR